MNNTTTTPIEIVREELAKGRAAAKCHPCGCFQKTVEALAASPLNDILAADLRSSREVFTPKEYDCLGCAVCFPAIAANAVADTLAQSGGLELCATEVPKERQGWPPLAGDYQVVRYGASVAVCTLNSTELAITLAAEAPEGLAISGTLHTENLGIERVIRNTLANPNLRFLVMCGEDTTQAIGHLPGQSLESLFREGIDERGRIRGARGKRPILKNVSAAQVDAFLRQIELVALIDVTDELQLARTIAHLHEQHRSPFTECVSDSGIDVIEAAEPKKMTSDPSGFFVVYPDRTRRRIVVEHYANDGVLKNIVEGTTAGAIYSTIIERALVTRLDHAAYLGRELSRALHALDHDEPYVQDRAPERDAVNASCGCGSTCS